MHILLLGSASTLTKTVCDMLTDIQNWSVNAFPSLEKAKAKVDQPSDFDIAIANLDDFPPPPTSTIEKITSQFPSLPLLVLYSYSRQLLITPLLNAGADGYLQIGQCDKILTEAVKSVVKGNQYVGVENT